MSVRCAATHCMEKLHQRCIPGHKCRKVTRVYLCGCKQSYDCKGPQRGLLGAHNSFLQTSMFAARRIPLKCTRLE